MKYILIKALDFLCWLIIVCGAIGGIIYALHIMGDGIPYEQFPAFIFSHPIRALFTAAVGFIIGICCTGFFVGFWVLISNINQNISELVKSNREQLKAQRLIFESMYFAQEESTPKKRPASNFIDNTATN